MRSIYLYLTRHIIAGCYVTEFPQALYPFSHFHRQSVRVLISAHACKHLSSAFWIPVILADVKRSPTMILIHISLMIGDIPHFLFYDLHYYPFGEMSIQTL